MQQHGFVCADLLLRKCTKSILNYQAILSFTLEMTITTKFISTRIYSGGSHIGNNAVTDSSVCIFHFAGGSFVSLKIYDIFGREIATLLHEELHPGSYQISRDASGQLNGVYYYKLKAGAYSEIKKITHQIISQGELS